MFDVEKLRKTASFMKLFRGISCTCDLDKWEPDPRTGHSFVCKIHKATMKFARENMGHFMEEDNGD